MRLNRKLLACRDTGGASFWNSGFLPEIKRYIIDFLSLPDQVAVWKVNRELQQLAADVLRVHAASSTSSIVELKVLSRAIYQRVLMELALGIKDYLAQCFQRLEPLEWQGLKGSDSSPRSAATEAMTNQGGHRWSSSPRSGNTPSGDQQLKTMTALLMDAPIYDVLRDTHESRFKDHFDFWIDLGSLALKQENYFTAWSIGVGLNYMASFLNELAFGWPDHIKDDYLKLVYLPGENSGKMDKMLHGTRSGIANVIPFILFIRSMDDNFINLVRMAVTREAPDDRAIALGKRFLDACQFLPYTPNNATDWINERCKALCELQRTEQIYSIPLSSLFDSRDS